jgi:hypothetical protein
MGNDQQLGFAGSAKGRYRRDKESSTTKKLVELPRMLKQLDVQGVRLSGICW